MVGALKVMMWNKSFATVLLMSSICGFVCNAYAVETKAKNAILMDYETGQYLYTKDHKKMVPPASMSKLMTVYMIFDKLKDGSLSLDDTFTVSENAWRKGGAASGESHEAGGHLFRVARHLRLWCLLRPSLPGFAPSREGLCQ